MTHLKDGFERLETAKAELLRSIAPLSPEILSRKPDAATWSILQVISHVTQAEAGTLRYIKKKTQDPKALAAAGFVSRLRVAALVAGFRSPFRFKAPKVLADPPESGDLQGSSLAWAEVREDWREFIETFPEELNDRLIFRHGVVGLLGPKETMIFMIEHLANHARQIGRIRRAMGV